MREENLTLYKLSNIKGFGPKTLNIIVEKFEEKRRNINDIFSITETEFIRLFPEFGKGRFKGVTYNALAEVKHKQTESSYLSLLESEIKIVTILDENYPKNVRSALTDAAPPVLYCKGDMGLFDQPSIAIAGSRKVDRQVITIAERIGEELAESGFVVITGYAKGIDASANIGALRKGGNTIAVLGSGIKENLGIINICKDKTLFVSQFLPEEGWSPRNAMIRNKLVCAFSKGMLIIASGPEKDQNGKMSGTFEAAKSALKMKIPLFVLSPSLFDDHPIGNKSLIEMGGIEVKNIKNIAESFARRQSCTREQPRLFGN